VAVMSGKFTFGKPCLGSYKYLGCVFTHPSGVGGTLGQVNTDMWTVFATLRRQYGRLRCAPALGLFSTCVTPSACYGSEVWSFLSVTPAQAAFRKTLRASQVQMLRQLAGVRTCVSTAILFRELDTLPLDHIWWSRAVQFWESIRRLPPDNIYYQVL
jgi:hypothetical protein